MRIRVLGCSGGIGAGARTSSMLIDDDILLDAGTGVGDLTNAELARIRHVFLTHSHLDHIASLPLLLDSAFDTLDGDVVTVYARRETLDALQTHVFNWVIWPDFAVLPTAEQPVLRYRLCDSQYPITLSGRTFAAVDVEHTVPAQGYVLHNGSDAFAISGDTTTNQTLWPALNAVERLKALVIEVSFRNDAEVLARESGHYCPRTMAADLAQLRHRPDIWVNAMKPGEEEVILNEVCAALPDRRVRMLERGTVLNV